MSSHARTPSVLLGVLLGVATQASWSQQPESADALEEVVITAEKREGTVQDTPISIAAFSGADLANLVNEAALLAARVLAAFDEELADRLDEWVERQTASVAEYPVDEAP